MRIVHADNAVSVAQVTFDAIFCNTFANDVRSFARNFAKLALRLRAIMLAHFGKLAAVTVDELAAIATGSPPAHPFAFNHDDAISAFGKFKRRRHAGEARTYDRHVAPFLAAQLRAFGHAIGGCGII